MADERGFTLLEVMVALVILVLALSGLYESLGLGVRMATRVDRQQRAVDAAETLLAELGRSRPLRAGITQGDFDRGGRWHLAVQPLPVETDPRTTLAVQGFSVAVTIDWPEERHAADVTVHTILLGPPE